MAMADVVEGVVAAEAVRLRRRGPEVTERDARALRWVGEQYGARLDVLAVLLGRYGDGAGPLTRWGVRNQVSRWERLGLADAERMASGVWVSLTRRGLDRTGLGRMRVVRVPLLRERHHHAVNAVRLAYEADQGRALGAPWTSERLAWAERGDETWHVPDGLIRGAGGAEAVEVELTRKPRPEYRDEVFGKLQRGRYPVRRVRYFVTDRRFAEALTEDITAALAGTTVPARWDVRLLPAVDGVTYMDRSR